MRKYMPGWDWINNDKKVAKDVAMNTIEENKALHKAHQAKMLRLRKATEQRHTNINDNHGPYEAAGGTIGCWCGWHETANTTFIDHIIQLLNTTDKDTP